MVQKQSKIYIVIKSEIFMTQKIHKILKIQYFVKRLFKIFFKWHMIATTNPYFIDLKDSNSLGPPWKGCSLLLFPGPEVWYPSASQACFSVFSSPLSNHELCVFYIWPFLVLIITVTNIKLFGCNLGFSGWRLASQPILHRYPQPQFPQFSLSFRKTFSVAVPSHLPQILWEES